MLEKDGENQLGRSCENRRITAIVKEERYILYTVKKEGMLIKLDTSCVENKLYKKKHY
jgi:hypothetical protein